MEQKEQRLIGILDNAALVLLVLYYINFGAGNYLVYYVGGLLLLGATYSYYSEGNGKVWIFEIGALALFAYWWFSIGFNSNFLYLALVCVVVACIVRIYIIYTEYKKSQIRKKRKHR